MPRAFLVVLDSVGIGGAPDADRFFNGDRPDTGANTLDHIAVACAALPRGPLQVPHLRALGLGRALTLASGQALPGPDGVPTGLWGAATEQSCGKDTVTGHWELAGVPLPFAWHVFPRTVPAFPDEVTAWVKEIAGCDGILGNCHASGTGIIARLGDAHLRTGWPICYTSQDSVFQIAAHEGVFGLARLHDLCATLAPRLHAMRVGRVIARPFSGDVITGFARTGNRRDYAHGPPGATLCDWVKAAGGRVLAIGKISDIFSGQGISDSRKGDDAALMRYLLAAVEAAPDHSLTFANLVEFDTLYGHRRDVVGYAAALERFDVWLGRMQGCLRAGDMLVITADHGNDPTWPGTDHTRERVPVLVAGRGTAEIGPVAFADVAATVADHLGVPAPGPGRSFLTD